jgi:hypothetical protein
MRISIMENLVEIKNFNATGIVLGYAWAGYLASCKIKPINGNSVEDVISKAESRVLV